MRADLILKIFVIFSHFFPEVMKKKDLYHGDKLTHCGYGLSPSMDNVFFFTDIYSCFSVAYPCLHHLYHTRLPRGVFLLDFSFLRTLTGFREESGGILKI